MYVYVVSFVTYQTKVMQLDTCAYSTKAKAEQSAKALRANGHTDVKVIKLSLVK